MDSQYCNSLDFAITGFPVNVTSYDQKFKDYQISKILKRGKKDDYTKPNL